MNSASAVAANRQPMACLLLT